MKLNAVIDVLGLVFFIGWAALFVVCILKPGFATRIFNSLADIGDLFVGKDKH